MSRQAKPLAKLTRPPGRGLLQHRRLFDVLDNARTGRVVWVGAPAGAGKTCLVAAWVAARGAPCLWVSLDRRDENPASFLGYLGDGARKLGVDVPPVPESGEFAGPFFEQVFDLAPAPLVVVLDGYHVLSPDAPVHAAVAALFDAVPVGSLAVVTSRNGLAPRLARWCAHRDFRSIGWRDLELTPDEVDALARLQGVADAAQLETIRGRSRGWSAGVALLARAAAGEAGVAIEALRDYFAAEVLEELPTATRRVMLRTAFLPYVSADLARTVAGDPAAGDVLEALHRAHLFTARRDGEPAVYDFHPLLRDVLQQQARETLDAPALRELLAASAAALERDGESEPAAALYAASGDWRSLSRTLRRSGDAIASHGRHATIARWIEAAPPEALAAEPWLAHWLGRCRLARRAPGAREQLAAAFAAFDRAGDGEGALSAIAWLLRSSATPDEAARWMVAAERAVPGQTQFADPETEARVIAQFLLAHPFPPRHSLIERFAQRARHLARALESPAGRTRMAAFALSVPVNSGDLRQLAALVAETRALAAREDAPPGDLVKLLLFHGYGQLQFESPAAAAPTVARMERLAAATGTVEALAATHYLAARSALIEGDAGRAREALQRLDVAGQLPFPYALHVGTLRVYLALLDDEPARAAAEARAVLAAGGPIVPGCRALWHANLGQALLAQGDPEAALREIDTAIALAGQWRLEAVGASARLLHSAAFLRLGDAARADVSLREGLATARILGCVPQLPFIVPALLAPIVARAIEHGIEREFVRATMARRGLPPPAAEEERWPWRVRLRALGAFEVAVDGKPLENGAKTQRKPIDLLKYLVAAGGRDVSFGALAQALWPEAEGDAAKRSFDVTLHRLRRLLGHDEAILLQGGKLTLNAGLVWVDALAFERLAVRADDDHRAGGVVAVELLERALRLYRGALLESDDVPWAHPARERLRRRFLQLAESLGERWERASDPDAALAWYHQAVGIEPAAERLHQRVIRVLQGQGRFAEALDAYRRCREVLAAVCGAAPSAETEALSRRLGRMDEAPPVAR